MVTSCMGEDLESDVSTLGYGRAVPDECSVEEVSSTFVFWAVSSVLVTVTVGRF